MAWIDQRNVSADIYVQHVDAAGNIIPGWPANGLMLCNAAGEQSRITLVVDGSGGVFLLWNDPRSGADAVYAQHILGSGAIAAGSWTANGLRVTNAGAQILPFGGYKAAAASDGAGGFFVTWSEYRPGLTANHQIFCTRITGAGSVASGWTPGGNQLSFKSVDQTRPMVVGYDTRYLGGPDGLGVGNAMVAWLDLQPFGFSNIWTVALNATGGLVPTWQAGGVNVVSTSASQTLDLLDVAPYDGITVLSKYQDIGGGTFLRADVHAYNASWTSYLVDVHFTSDTFSDAVVDVFGFAAWNAQPSSGLPVTKIQRLGFNPTGIATGFPTTGLTLATPIPMRPVSISSSFTANLPDVVVAVPGTPNGAKAFGVTGSGTTMTGWPSGGALFSGVTGLSVLQTSLVRHPSGAALLGWADPRVGICTYAQLISGSGVVAADIVPPAAPQVFAQGQCTVNGVDWTNSGDDGQVGQATLFEVRRALSPITTESAWNSASFVAVGTPLASGQMQSVTDNVGSCSEKFYYAVRLTDDVGNRSAIGASTSWAKTLCPGPEDPPCENALQTELEGPAPELGGLRFARNTPTVLRTATEFQLFVPKSVRGSSLSFQILDLSGRVVTRSVLPSRQDGLVSAAWDLRRDTGEAVPAGVYFVSARAGSQMTVRRFVVLR